MIASALDRALVRRFYEIVITVIVVTVAFFCCYMSFRDLHAKSDEMNDALSRWASNAAYINSQSYRPVLPEQVDAVSADIFNAVLAHRLGLVSLILYRAEIHLIRILLMYSLYEAHMRIPCHS